MDVVVPEPAPDTSASSSTSSMNADATPEATLAPVEPSLDFSELGMSIQRAKEVLAPYQKQIQDNIAEGNLGERGEEWAVAQVKTVSRVKHTRIIYWTSGSTAAVGTSLPLTARVGHLD